LQHDTKRTPIARSTKTKITPRVVARKAVALQEEDGATNRWEEDGGRRREYLNLCHKLHLALGRKLHEACVTETVGQDAPHPTILRQGAERLRDWMAARDIRRKLDQAAGVE
jgi:hypothetical protein